MKRSRNGPLKRAGCSLDLNAEKYSLLNGSKYLALPKLVKDKEVVIDVRNSVSSGLYYPKSTTRR